MNIRYIFAKFIHVWITIPIFIYAVLFLTHAKVQKWYGDKCDRNFIVEMDKWLFGDFVYLLVDRMQNTFLDFLSALPYLIHYSLPFLYSIYLALFVREYCKFYQFILSFGIVCVMSTVLQHIIPTAPPWLLAEDKPPEANFARVDAAIQLNLFKSIYAMSTCVCGAFPSIHAAWPTVILFTQPWIGKWFCWGHVGLIMFAAVYSMHHYIIDVLFGFVFAWISCMIGKYIMKSVTFTSNHFNLRSTCIPKEIFLCSEMRIMA